MLLIEKLLVKLLLSVVKVENDGLLRMSVVEPNSVLVVMLVVESENE